MHLLKKIIILFICALFISCQTQLEKQGWQRTAIVSQLDTSTIKKDKELVVEKMKHKSSYYYKFYFFKKDSTGKIIKGHFWGLEKSLSSGIAYYKWESDSTCFVKLLNNGDVQVSLKFINHNDSSSRMEILN